MSMRDHTALTILIAGLLVLPGCSLVHAQQPTIDQEELASPQLGRGYRGLFFSSPGSGYVYTESEVLYTGNGGQSWQLLYSVPAPEKITETFFLDANTAWLGTKSHGVYPVKLYRTRDGFASVEVLGGVTYQRHDKAAWGFGDNIFFLNSDRGWSSGGNHALVSADGGNTWTGNLVPEHSGKSTGW
jgi:hypothetical protein